MIVVTGLLLASFIFLLTGCSNWSWNPLDLLDIDIDVNYTPTNEEGEKQQVDLIEFDNIEEIFE